MFDPRTDTYHEIKAMIHQMAIRFGKNNQGHDDYLSIGNEAFMRAYDTYDGSTAFTTYAWTCCRNAMIKHYHHDRKYTTRYLSNSIDREVGVDHDEPRHELHARESRMDDLLRDLGDDARQIVAMVIEGPGEIAKLLRMRDPQKIRVGIWHYLRSLGWSMGRVSSAFDEVRESLG